MAPRRFRFSLLFLINAKLLPVEHQDGLEFRDKNLPKQKSKTAT